MQRYFIKNVNKHENAVTVTNNNDIHHIRNVMRMTPGAEIICIDEDGLAYQCAITDMTDSEVRTSIEELLDDNTEMPVDVTIFQGLPKKNKLELIIQKGTELGCSQFKLFPADRSIVKWDQEKIDQKLKRFEKISKEASEQSGRSKVPIIEAANSLKELLINKNKYDIMLFAYEEEAKTDDHQSIANALEKCSERMRIGLFIGPEGGFSEREAAFFKRNGIDSVRLGPRILRTETASVYALACISYHFEEMGCP